MATPLAETSVGVHEGARPRERVDPRVIAALINRFISSNAEYMQSFAATCEVRLLELSKRIQNLETLLRLLETKLSSVDATALQAPSASSTATSSTATATASASVAPSATGDSGANSVAENQTAASVPETTAPSAVSAPTAEQDVEVAPPARRMDDPMYEKYAKMHRARVPLLAIRQALMIDMNMNPALDPSVLDELDSEGILNTPAPRPPAPKPAPKPAPSPPSTVAEGDDAAESGEPVEEPVEAAPPKRAPPAPSHGDALAAAIARRRAQVENPVAAEQAPAKAMRKASPEEDGSVAPQNLSGGPPSPPPKGKGKGPPPPKTGSHQPQQSGEDDVSAAPPTSGGPSPPKGKGKGPPPPKTGPPAPKQSASVSVAEMMSRRRRNVANDDEDSDQQSDLSDF